MRANEHRRLNNEPVRRKLDAPGGLEATAPSGRAVPRELPVDGSLGDTQDPLRSTDRRLPRERLHRESPPMRVGQAGGGSERGLPREKLRSAPDDWASSSEDLQWSLGLNRLAMEMLGVWPSDAGPQPRSVEWRVPALIVAMLVCVTLPQMCALRLVLGELPLVIDNFVTNCGSITASAKYFFLWRNKRALRPVLLAAREDWLREKPAWERALMLQRAGRARLFTLGGYWLLACCYAGFTLLPLLGFGIRIANNLTDMPGRPQLLFQTWYPFDYWRPPYFQLTELLQLLTGFFIGLSISAPDNYFGALVLHTSAQFEILGRKAERWLAEPGGPCHGVAHLVATHVRLVRTVAAIERAFSFVMLAQVLNMSFLICCVGFQLIGILTATSDTASYLPILTLVGVIEAFAMNTFVDCYASETLASTSSRLFDSIYNCNWYAVSPQLARDLLPMMRMSLAPQQLTAGKIFQLSMTTYCSLVKSAGGYISMLLAVNSR